MPVEESGRFGAGTRPAGCEERCPACPQRGLSPAESEERNNAWLARELLPWQDRLRPILSPAMRWGYRRKVLLHARRRDGAWQFGMIRMHGREEEFIPIPDCPLHHPSVNQVLGLAAAKLTDLPLAFALVSGRALNLVMKCERRVDIVSLLREWEPGWPGGSLWVNWNPVAGKRATDSRHNELIFGEEWLEEGGLLHGPSAFRQQIPELEEKALKLAEEWFKGAGHNEKVAVDLYSGLGASLHRWQAGGWDSIGVELSGESVRAAERNAPGAKVLRGRTEDRLPQVDDFLKEREFVAYTNPPRSGHGEKVLQWLTKKRPLRLAYLSCHPRSLAGDLRELSSAFEVETLQPFDFFPQTGHVETLALLKRK